MARKSFVISIGYRAHRSPKDFFFSLLEAGVRSQRTVYRLPPTVYRLPRRTGTRQRRALPTAFCPILTT
jgi:hypothetical protein